MASVVVTAVVVALALLLAAVMGARLMGLTPYAVLSGSMEPLHPVGSMVYVRGVDPERLQPGDSVTFRTQAGSIATHQVHHVNAEDHTVTTQGIANVDSEGRVMLDAQPVPFSDVIGRVSLCVPLLGYAWVAVSNHVSMACVMLVLALLCLASALIEGSGGECGHEGRNAKPCLHGRLGRR